MSNHKKSLKERFKERLDVWLWGDLSPHCTEEKLGVVAWLMIWSMVGLVTVVPAGFVMWKMLEYGSECKQERQAEAFASYYKYNPVVVPASFDDGSEEASKPLPKAKNYVEARSRFKSDMKRIYSHKCYEHSPKQVRVFIEGDTLYLAALCYKDQINRYIVQQDKNYASRFKECEFAEVRLTPAYAGGSSYWVIYRDKHIKHVTARKNAQKSKVRAQYTTREKSLDDEIDDRVQDILHEHGLDEGDLEY